MAYFFSSDAHFDHCNILIYAGRPFKNPDNATCASRTRCNGCYSIPICLKNMNETLVANWNSAVKPEDTVFHVGDFCFHSLASYWESLLNGKVIHVKGNHDKLSNGVDTPLEIALMNLGHYQVLVQHRPPTMELEIPEIADFVLCGHVHEKWKHRWLGNKMLINVGTDVWNFRPVSIPEIITYFEQHKNEPVTIRIPISN